MLDLLRRRRQEKKGSGEKGVRPPFAGKGSDPFLYSGLEEWFRQTYGHGLDGLTNAEARHLLRFNSLERIRSALAAGEKARGLGADAPGGRGVHAETGGRGAGGARAGPAAQGEVAPPTLAEAARAGYGFDLVRSHPRSVAPGLTTHVFRVTEPAGRQFEVAVTAHRASSAAEIAEAAWDKARAKM